MDKIQIELEILRKALFDIITPYVKLHEYITLIETIGILIHDLIDSDPMIYANCDFEHFIKEEITNLLDCQFENIIDYNQYFLENIINEALTIFYSYIAPRRSYKKSFIRKKPNSHKMKSKITYLENIPQPEQRTDEWYKFRYKYLTASNIWKAFGSNSSVNQLIYDKCKPLDINKYKSVCTNSPMHWGQKYEPLSIMWYESKYNTTVSDFGCIPHKNISFLAASPDGINTYNNNERYGRMVEVKNIVNRIINGIPKMEYWIQMQVQMEVCNLNECDFLETRFIEYENKEEFIKDGSYRFTNQGKQKGIIMYFIKDGKPLYEYAPWNCSQKDFELWENEMMIRYENLTWMQNIYWYLDQVSCVLVLRNKYWFSIAKSQLYSICNTIEKERISGYSHRAPNKKNKVSNKLKPKIPKCYIDINSLQTNNNEVTKIPKCYIDINSLQLDNNEVTKNNTVISNNSAQIIHIETETLLK